jgi:hypothetical protein
VARLFSDRIPRRVSTLPLPLTKFQGVPPEAACTMRNGSCQVEMTWTTRFWWLPGVAVSQTATSNIFQMDGIDDDEDR